MSLTNEQQRAIEAAQARANELIANAKTHAQRAQAIQQAALELAAAEHSTTYVAIGTGHPMVPPTPEQKRERERLALAANIALVHAETSTQPSAVDKARLEEQRFASEVEARKADIAASRATRYFTPGGE